MLLGSNIRPAEHLPRALAALRARLPVMGWSTVWETPPVGTTGPPFYNAAVAVRTSLTPEALKARVLRPIETALGRRRTADRFAPRTIDLDLVVYDGRVWDADVWRYAHVAVPLAELLPTLRHPETGETLAVWALRWQQKTSLRRVHPPGWPSAHGMRRA